MDIATIKAPSGAIDGAPSALDMLHAMEDPTTRLENLLRALLQFCNEDTMDDDRDICAAHELITYAQGELGTIWELRSKIMQEIRHKPEAVASSALADLAVAVRDEKARRAALREARHD